MAHVWWRVGSDPLCHAFPPPGDQQAGDHLAACSGARRPPDGAGGQAHGPLCVACLVRLEGAGAALAAHPGPRSGQPC
ncbi:MULTISPECIES: hypothetical protein [Actinosynnema]|uniref:Uncharacterized protein n=1 Tax=Actinosynnema pretiosum TaxID=42197 RepID=A0A290Z0E9_9PSEU|nr:hypothetical protein [Actinosynnema pretiosum]ATE52465.1 hypothetical protein CNX65_03485 [Actinosynnema pretiosum]